ncbi:MAG TPA: hypothetical protein VMU93_03795 [Caulobacteraceae bacterium]|nr:hypothetical protein [Caulobacteraceae bacterium]
MTSTADPITLAARKDWARRPLAFIVWWGLPTVLGVCASFKIIHHGIDVFDLSQRQLAFVWTALFFWMASGCLLNALRCRRLHCYVSGPALLLGALASGLLGLRQLTLGPGGLNMIIAVTTVLVAASFVPELTWKRYA